MHWTLLSQKANAHLYANRSCLILLATTTKERYKTQERKLKLEFELVRESRYQVDIAVLLAVLVVLVVWGYGRAYKIGKWMHRIL